MARSLILFGPINKKQTPEPTKNNENSQKVKAVSGLARIALVMQQAITTIATYNGITNDRSNGFFRLLYTNSKK